MDDTKVDYKAFKKAFMTDVANVASLYINYKMCTDANGKIDIGIIQAFLKDFAEFFVGQADSMTEEVLEEPYMDNVAELLNKTA